MMDSVFSYTDYRLLLMELLERVRERYPTLTTRKLNLRLGFKASNGLLMVTSGRRNLTEKSAMRLGKALSELIDFSAEEQKFLTNLCLLNQAKTKDEMLLRSKVLSSLKSGKGFYKINKEIIQLYASWYTLVIREMTLLKNFEITEENIIERLNLKESSKEIEKSIQTLINLGFLEKVDEKLERKKGTLATPNQVPSSFIRMFHKEMLQRAQVSIDDTHSSLREISSLTFPINIASIERAKELIIQFREEFLAEISEKKDADEIYQLNIQLFPLSHKKDKNPEEE